MVTSNIERVTSTVEDLFLVSSQREGAVVNTYYPSSFGGSPLVAEFQPSGGSGVYSVAITGCNSDGGLCDGRFQIERVASGYALYADPREAQRPPLTANLQVSFTDEVNTAVAPVLHNIAVTVRDVFRVSVHNTRVHSGGFSGAEQLSYESTATPLGVPAGYVGVFATLAASGGAGEYTYSSNNPHIRVDANGVLSVLDGGEAFGTMRTTLTIRDKDGNTPFIGSTQSPNNGAPVNCDQTLINEGDNDEYERGCKELVAGGAVVVNVRQRDVAVLNLYRPGVAVRTRGYASSERDYRFIVDTTPNGARATINFIDPNNPQLEPPREETPGVLDRVRARFYGNLFSKPTLFEFLTLSPDSVGDARSRPVYVEEGEYLRMLIDPTFADLSFEVVSGGRVEAVAPVRSGTDFYLRMQMDEDSNACSEIRVRADYGMVETTHVFLVLPAAARTPAEEVTDRTGTTNVDNGLPKGGEALRCFARTEADEVSVAEDGAVEHTLSGRLVNHPVRAFRGRVYEAGDELFAFQRLEGANEFRMVVESTNDMPLRLGREVNGRIPVVFSRQFSDNFLDANRVETATVQIVLYGEDGDELLRQDLRIINPADLTEELSATLVNADGDSVMGPHGQIIRLDTGTTYSEGDILGTIVVTGGVSPYSITTYNTQSYTVGAAGDAPFTVDNNGVVYVGPGFRATETNPVTIYPLAVDIRDSAPSSAQQHIREPFAVYRADSTVSIGVAAGAFTFDFIASTVNIIGISFAMEGQLASGRITVLTKGSGLFTAINANRVNFFRVTATGGEEVFWDGETATTSSGTLHPSQLRQDATGVFYMRPGRDYGVHSQTINDFIHREYTQTFVYISGFIRHELVVVFRYST